MTEPYSTTGPLLGLKYQNQDTGERTAELRANLYVEGDLDVNGQISQNGVPLESGAAFSLPYTSYVALLSQTGTDAPVPTVIENTLGGTVVWTRVGVGHYAATLAGAFTANKTIVFLTGNGISQFGTIVGFLLNSVNIIEIKTSDASDSFAPIDGRMLGTSIEIRVYE